MFESFSKLVKERQSCRNFTDKKVEESKIEKIMDLAMLAPSACNSQPWKMYCVTSEQAVNNVRESLQLNDRNKFLDNVSTFIAVADQQATLKPGMENRIDRNRFVQYDVGELVAYITLTAKSIGLDTCIIGWMDEEKLHSSLGLSENEHCRLVVALGYGDTPLREKIRKDKDTIIKRV